MRMTLYLWFMTVFLIGCKSAQIDGISYIDGITDSGVLAAQAGDVPEVIKIKTIAGKVVEVAKTEIQNASKESEKATASAARSVAMWRSIAGTVAAAAVVFLGILIVRRT